MQMYMLIVAGSVHVNVYTYTEACTYTCMYMSFQFNQLR